MSNSLSEETVSCLLSELFSSLLQTVVLLQKTVTDLSDLECSVSSHCKRREETHLKSLFCWSLNFLLQLLEEVYDLYVFIDLKAAVFKYEDKAVSDLLICQDLLKQMLLLSYMSTEKLILLKEKTVTLKLITERSEICSLSKKLILLLQLFKNKLLHRIWELSHLWEEDDVWEIKRAEVYLYLHSLSVSLSDSIDQLFNEVKKRLSDHLSLDLKFQRSMSKLNHIDWQHLKKQNRVTINVVNSLCSDISSFFLNIALLLWQSFFYSCLNTLLTFRLCFSIVESSTEMLSTTLIDLLWENFLKSSVRVHLAEKMTDLQLLSREI